MSEQFPTFIKAYAGTAQHRVRKCIAVIFIEAESKLEYALPRAFNLSGRKLDRDNIITQQPWQRNARRL